MHRVTSLVPLAAATLVSVVLTACDSGSAVTSKPSATESSTEASSTSRSTASTPPASPDAPRTDLNVAAAAQNAFARDDIQTAWDDLGTWILQTGFQPDLARTTVPTAAQLTSITAQMTPTCAAAFQADAATPNDTNIGSLETLTAIGVRAPDGTILDGDDAITDRAITAASADVDAKNNLTITANSSADIHYRRTSDASVRFHSTFARRVTYTLVKQDGRWLVDNWSGTYTTTDPIDD